MNASPTPEVSVVIVAWNARQYALTCIASIQEYLTLPFEIVVVDDGSEDGTSEAISRCFPSVRLITKPRNEGLVAGRNEALSLVKGRLVLMLDADTEVKPGSIEKLARVLDQHAQVGLVSPKLVYPDGELQYSCRRYPSPLLPLVRRGPYARLHTDPALHRRHLMRDFNHEHQRAVVWTAGAAQMYRATLPARIGVYDPRLSSYGGEDMDWSVRVIRAGLEVWYVPDAVVTHVFQQVTRRRPFGRKSFRALRDFYYLQWKHRQMRRSQPILVASR